MGKIRVSLLIALLVVISLAIFVINVDYSPDKNYHELYKLQKSGNQFIVKETSNLPSNSLNILVKNQLICYKLSSLCNDPGSYQDFAANSDIKILQKKISKFITFINLGYLNYSFFTGNFYPKNQLFYHPLSSNISNLIKELNANQELIVKGTLTTTSGNSFNGYLEISKVNFVGYQTIYWVEPKKY